MQKHPKKVKWIEYEWLLELFSLRHCRVGLPKSHIVNSCTMNNFTVFVDLHVILILTKSYSSKLLSTVRQRISPTTEKTFIHNCLLIRCCWVKGIRHYIFLVHVTISVFRWWVRCYTDQGIETCETFSRQHMGSQARLRLRRNCKFYSHIDARPPCGFSHCVFAHAGTFGLKNRKSAVKES